MIKGKKDFYCMEEINACLEKSEQYKGRYFFCDTFLGQEQVRWRRGKKRDFQNCLKEKDLDYFAYIKFYIDKQGKKFGIVAGKSGSYNVNSSGCDLSFSENPQHGKARQWLIEHNVQWCKTKILVIKTNAKGQESEKEAFKIEGDLKEKFNLFGS